MRVTVPVCNSFVGASHCVALSCLFRRVSINARGAQIEIKGGKCGINLKKKYLPFIAKTFDMMRWYFRQFT